MADYYLVVEIGYVEYKNMKTDKVRIKREFDEPQESLEFPLLMCIKDFYIRKEGCDIDSITVIANALFA